MGDVSLHRLRLVKDLRGDLFAGEMESDIPFVARRYCMVLNVPTLEVRGEHAHRKCHQFLVCAKGSCSGLVDDGARRRNIVLSEPNLGLYIPPMIWGTHGPRCAAGVRIRP